MHKVKLVSDKGKPAPTIFEYIWKRKNGQRIRVGVLVGTRNGSYYGVGFSQANIKEGDQFDSISGFGIAISRALGYIESPKIPNGLVKQFVVLKQDANLIFKKC